MFLVAVDAHSKLPEVFVMKHVMSCYVAIYLDVLEAVTPIFSVMHMM